MGEFFITFVIFIGVTALAGVLFTGWVIYSIVHAGVRVVNSVTGVTRRNELAQLTPCAHIRCNQMNPAGARFCRRCGKSTTDSVTISQNRAAA